jgi:hypothetical protein
VFGEEELMDPSLRDHIGPEYAMSDYLTELAKTNPEAANAFRHTFANANFIDPNAPNYIGQFNPIHQSSYQRPTDEYLTGYYDRTANTVRGLSNTYRGRTAAHELIHGMRSWDNPYLSSPLMGLLGHEQMRDLGFTVGLGPQVTPSRTALRDGTLMHGDISAYDAELEDQRQDRDTDARVRSLNPYDIFHGRIPGQTGLVDRLPGRIQEFYDRDTAYANHPLTPNLDADFPGHALRRGEYWSDYSGAVQPFGIKGSVRNLTADAGPGYTLFGNNIGIGNLNPVPSYGPSPDAAFTPADLAQLPPEVGFFGTGIDLGGDSVDDAPSDMTADDYSDSYAF